MLFNRILQGTKQGVLHKLRTDPRYQEGQPAHVLATTVCPLLEDIHDKVSFVKLEASGHSTPASYSETSNELFAGNGNIDINLTWNCWEQFYTDPHNGTVE